MLMMSIICLTSCVSTNDCSYQFPKLPESERIVENKNITVKDKDGNIVFYFDAEKDSVTVPFWYWQKIMNYAIDTKGL